MEIKVYIQPDGEVELSVEGVKGKQCLKLTEFLEQTLGKVTDREFKPAYYETATEVEKATIERNLNLSPHQD